MAAQPGVTRSFTLRSGRRLQALPLLVSACRVKPHACSQREVLSANRSFSALQQQQCKRGIRERVEGAWHGRAWGKIGAGELRRAGPAIGQGGGGAKRSTAKFIAASSLAGAFKLWCARPVRGGGGGGGGGGGEHPVRQPPLSRMLLRWRSRSLHARALRRGLPSSTMFRVGPAVGQLPFPSRLAFPSPASPSSLAVPCCPRVRCEAPPPTRATPQPVPAPAPAPAPGRRMKKKVAIWLGYVGTRYKGLQIQRGPGSAQTIEEELERAIFKAGGIIESNFGNLAKLSWTRSSRTDKGVHSLCTVISMKMEVPEAAWVNDLDGFILADSINSHLSPFIRIFGIVPVTRSFRARHDCCTRSYDYLLPAAIIGIHPDTDSLEVEQRVTKFQSLLHLFEGKHAYHNYTIRRLYRPFPQKPYKSRPHDRYDKGMSNENNGKPSTITNTVELEFLDVEDFTEELSDVLEGELANETVDTFADDILREEEVPKTSNVILSGPFLSDQRAWWLPTPNGSDKVWSSHFRKVFSCTCGMPETFEEAQFIRISITGSSFMVHQIRKMIGTAIAAFHDLLPRDIIPVSLARHSRIVLPVAPPDGLILVRNEFMPFRLPPIHQKKTDIEADTPPVRRTQEKHPKLEMSSKIRHKVEEFCEIVLMPDILPLISAKTPNWIAWMMNLERNVTIPGAEMAEVRAAWAEWREQSVRLRQMRNQSRKHRTDLSQHDQVFETKQFE